VYRRVEGGKKSRDVDFYLLEKSAKLSKKERVRGGVASARNNFGCSATADGRTRQSESRVSERKGSGRRMFSWVLKKRETRNEF